MRTDSKKYSNEFVENTKKHIKSEYGEEYISGGIEKLILTDDKDAHEAIRPVNVLCREPVENTEIDNKCIKLYKLIWKRTVESCMSSSQYSCITAPSKSFLLVNRNFPASSVVPVGGEITWSELFFG